MRLTVIMPLYNRERYVEAALMSLLRQDLPAELDVLVVNDGSTDDGPARVAALAQKHPQIRMVTTANQGVTRARNHGLSQLTDDCDLVTFLDSDDISPADRLQGDLSVFQRRPEVQITYGKMTLVDRIDDARFQPADDATHVTVRGISLSAAIFRRPFLQSIGVFDESFDQAEDADFLFRAFETGELFELTDTVCVYYRQHAGNMTRQRQQLRKSIMKALHYSVLRRRKNPQRKLPTDIFDLNPLIEIQGA